MNTKQILIVEDDAEISRLTDMYLQAEGYDTITAADGLQALDQIKLHSPDLVILDLMLPEMDGIEVCKHARTFYQGPILVMTARDDDLSEVSLLKLGADDYLTKPIRPHIMIARIEALLRRTATINPPVQTSSISIGEVTIDTATRQAYYQGEALNLATAEFDMLSILAQHAGQAVSRDDCCQALRGINYDFNDRSVDMRISGLRKKLNDAHPPYKVILTVRNKGYMLVNG